MSRFDVSPKQYTDDILNKAMLYTDKKFNILVSWSFKVMYVIIGLFIAGIFWHGLNVLREGIKEFREWRNMNVSKIINEDVSCVSG